MSLRPEPTITPELVKSHGLKPEEYERFVKLLGRTPSYTELGICSAMWNEHCSYKSSKKWLKTMPTTGPKVIQGPGENAGVIDIGDGDAIVFKMESHNHPSFIDVADWMKPDFEPPETLAGSRLTIVDLQFTLSNARKFPPQRIEALLRQ